LGSAPDIVSEDKKPGQQYANAEVRRMFVDQPFLGSGDYFREREQDWDRLQKSDDETKVSAQESDQRLENMEQRLASVEESLHTRQDVAVDPVLGDKAQTQPDQGLEPVLLGFLIDDSAVKSRVRMDINDAIASLSGNDSWRIYPDQALHDLLAPSGYIENKKLGKISQALSLYPGVRMLFLIEDAQVPDKLKGNILLKVTLVDTGIPYRYPMIELEASVDKGSDVQSAFTSVFEKLAAYATEKSQVMPGHYRVFDHYEDKVIINAGSASDISVGDELEVIPEGKVIHAPTGVPVRWLPKKATGRIRVQEILGSDASLCGVLEGTVPEQGMFLLPGKN
jgi:hypothetical protein